MQIYKVYFDFQNHIRINILQISCHTFVLSPPIPILYLIHIHIHLPFFIARSFYGGSLKTSDHYIQSQFAFHFFNAPAISFPFAFLFSFLLLSALWYKNNLPLKTISLSTPHYLPVFRSKHPYNILLPFYH